jgi:WD40 repeat protein
MKSPFKFLDSYTRDDRAIFFGRDREISELYRRVFESKILLVYGISGTGKSSLINCGLASGFDDSDWLPVNVRRGSNIIESLNEAFIKQAISPLKKNLSVSGKLQSIYLDHFKPVYLIFDQFEELFIFGSSEEKTGFIKLIKEVVESETQCRVIFIIREEFLAGITEFEYELPEIFSNRFRVEKMKRANAIQAVEGPCKVYDIDIETGFSEELIDKLCPSGNEIELTFLQIYLDRIFRIAVEDKHEDDNLKFSKELLSMAGSVSDLLGQFLEEQIREFDDPNTGMAILKSFVSVQGTKRPMNESEILDSVRTFGTVISEPDLLKYITKLVDLRILRERDDSGHFELRHDALAAKIYEKFTLIEKELLEVSLFVENAFLAFHTRKTYLTRDDLEYLSTYEKRLFLSPRLSSFVSESKDKLQLQQKALKRLTSLVAIIFLFIIGAGVQYYLNKKGYAQTRELTALALLQEKVDPLTGINTALKARQNDSLSTVIQGIIFRCFNNLLQEKLASGDTSLPKELLPKSIPVSGSILSMHMNKAGSYLYGWTDSREIFTFGVNDSIVRSFRAENKIVTIEMSPNSSYLAVIYQNSTGEVYTRNGRKLFAFETTVNNLMNDRLVCFFPSGKYFMAAVKDNKAVIYDSTGKDLFDLSGHTGRVNSLDISADGRFVATASSDKSIIIWNFNYNTKHFSPYDTLKGYKDKLRGFGQPDSIIGPKDTIWSCEFNSTAKYLLTASADSTLNIWNMNGILLNEGFAYGMNSLHGIRYYWPLWDTRINKYDLRNNYLPGYYNKICDAAFAADEKAIIASNYSYNNITDGKQAGIFRTHVLYFDLRSSENEYAASSTNPYIIAAQSQTKSDLAQTISLMEVTSDRQLFAAVPDQKEVIQIVASDGYQLESFPGSFPVFTKDGRHLVYIYKSKIRFLPLSTKEIYSLVIRKKLLGNPETGGDIWRVL